MSLFQCFKSMFVLVFAVVSTSCSSIPPNAPSLLNVASERIETRSEVVVKVLRTASDEAGFVAADIKGVRFGLSSIDLSGLSVPDKEKLASAIKTLESSEKSLIAINGYGKVSDESKQVFEQSVGGIRLVSGILSESVENEAIIDRAIGLITKNDDN